MIKLCCPAAVAMAYVGGTLELAEAMRSLNVYRTTLHGINSAIIKAPPHRRHAAIAPA